MSKQLRGIGTLSIFLELLPVYYMSDYFCPHNSILIDYSIIGHGRMSGNINKKLHYASN